MRFCHTQHFSFPGGKGRIYCHGTRWGCCAFPAGETSINKKKIRVVLRMDFVVLVVLGSIVALGVIIAIGLQYGKVAESKGYNKNTWTAAAIFFGAIVWILIVALPDKTRHGELMAALEKIERACQNQAQGGAVSVTASPDELPDL